MSDRKKIILEAKRTHQIERKSFSKRSKHIRQKENYFRSEANTFDGKKTVFKAKANMADRKKIIFEAKGNHQIERKSFSKRSELIRQKENYFRSEANTFDGKKIIFEAKRTRSTLKGHGNEPVFPTFCINRFGIGPLHYCSSRSDFGKFDIPI